MPYVPLTPLGALEDLVARTAPYAQEASGIVTIVSTDTGTPADVRVTGDAAAAVIEAFAALLAHLLASTNDPRTSTFLIQARDAIGL